MAPQDDLGNLESPLSGEEFINDKLEPWRDALHSTHSGDARPSYVVPNMLWVDETTNPRILNFFTGSVDVPLFTIDTVGNTALASGIAVSAFIQTLLDDANATAARATLGLVIGSNVQAYNAILALISGLTAATNKGIYFTSGSAMATFDLTAAGRALLDDADTAAQRATLGLGTGAVLNFGTGANELVRLDGSARLPAVDGSQLTNLSQGTTIFDGNLSSGATQDFTWSAGAYNSLKGSIRNMAHSGSAAVSISTLLRVIDNGTLKGSNGTYNNSGFVAGTYSGAYERSNAFTLHNTNQCPSGNLPGLNIEFEMNNINDYPNMRINSVDGVSAGSEAVFNSQFIQAISSMSGVQLLNTPGTRNFSTNSHFKLIGYP